MVYPLATEIKCNFAAAMETAKMDGQFLVLDQPLLGRPTLGQCILVREA